MSRLIFLDTETTSLSDINGEVWEIGAIVRDPGFADVEYLWQIRPTLEDADPNSLRICRYYERIKATGLHAAVRLDSATGNILKEVAVPRVARELAQLLDGAHIVGGVPDFDYRHLRKFLTNYGECWTAHYHLIDSETLAIGYLYGHMPSAVKQMQLPWKSSAVCKAIGIHPDLYEEHTAIGDARLVRDVYDKVTGRIPAAAAYANAA